MVQILRTYTVAVNSVQDKVYHTLRDEILNLILKPGTSITTQETADRFGVSRTPVREAFIRLQGAGLLEVAPQRGTTVSRINLERVYQERFIRESLEVENLQRFVPLLTDEILETLRQGIRLQREAMEAGQNVAYKDLDDDFHRLAFQVTREDLSVDILQQANGNYDRIRLLSTWVKPIPFNAIDQHVQLVETLERRDLPRSQQLMRDHLRMLSAQESTMVDLFPDFFE